MERLSLTDIKKLALLAAEGKAPASFSNNGTDCDVNQALRDQINLMANSYIDFERNKLDLFEIIMTTADEIVPRKVIDTMGAFADVRVIRQGDTTLFRRKLGRQRAKKFITQVGLSGVYESFRLDAETFPIKAHAIGGAVSIDFERFLDGAEVMSDLMDIVLEGLEDAIYGEVQKALIAAASVAGRPTANLVSSSGFDADKMAAMVATVKAYGSGVTIFATPEFINAMGPDVIVPAIANVAQGLYSPKDIEAIHDTGRIRIFRGTPIVEIPQSYIDETNTSTCINPRYAWVLPTGDERVVKVVLEGQTQMWDRANIDQSREIFVYKKVGVAIMSHHNWGIFVNTSITDTSAWPYGT